GIVVLGQLGCLEVTIADGLDLLLELHRVLLRRVQPVAAFVGLQRRLTEITTHLGGGDRVDDAALDYLISKLEDGPVRDRASGFLGRFAGDGEDLDDLLRGKLAGGASSEIVGKDLLNGPAQGHGGLGTLNQHETIESCGPAHGHGLLSSVGKPGRRSARWTSGSAGWTGRFAVDCGAVSARGRGQSGQGGFPGPGKAGGLPPLPLDAPRRTCSRQSPGRLPRRLPEFLLPPWTRGCGRG